jgi:hypothetical protein
MIPIWIGRKVIDGIATKFQKARELRLLKKGNKKRDNHEIQIQQQQKTINKQGKTIEENEKNIATMKAKIVILEKDSHPSQEYICCRECGCKIAKTKIRKKEK